MLISRRDGGLWLVTQPDHAALAGELAAHWGNERFALGEARASLELAARRHDDGWAAIDGVPAVSATEGRPAHFLEVDLSDTVAPYGQGVDRIYDDDRRAGVLSSRHWAGLYSSRWGVQDSPAVGHPAAVAVVAEQEARAAVIARELWGGKGLRSAFERELWRDYEVLQAVDLLSLALCLIDTGVATDPQAGSWPVPDTLRGLDQPAGARRVPNVPTAADEHTTIGLRVTRPGVVELDPFPLARSGAQFTVRARRLADVRHPSVQAAADAFAQAPITTVRFAVVAAGTG